MRILLALLLLATPCFGQYAHAGGGVVSPHPGGPLWTVTQHPNDGFTCSTYSCSLTGVTTTAGDLLILTGVIGSVTASTPTSASGDSTWTHCPTSYSSANTGSFLLQTDCYYIPVAAGATSATFTMNWSSGGTFVGGGISLTEIHRASGSATYDIGDEKQDFGCTACVGPTITTTGASDYILVWSAASNTSTGPGGAWTSPSFDGAVAGAANQPATAYTATWAFGSSSVAAMATVAFK